MNLGGIVGRRGLEDWSGIGTVALVDRRVGRSRLEAGKVSNVRGTKQRGGYEGGEGQWIPYKMADG